MRRLRTALPLFLIACLCALTAASPGRADTAPLVQLVQRYAPEHPALDAARAELVRATAAGGEGSPVSRAAARAYARESGLYAARVAAMAAATPAQADLRNAVAATNRTVAADLRAYASGDIDAAELDARTSAERARASEQLAALVAAAAADEGLDESMDGAAFARDMAPVMMLIIGVVGLGAFTRRRSASVRRSRTS